MSYLGLLAGYSYVHEVCQHETFVEFLLGYMAREAVPTLRPVPGIDLGAYSRQLIERFASTAIQDTLERLIFDSSERIPKFLLPVVREQLASGGEIGHAALVVASWSLYAAEAGAGGRFPALPDARAEQLSGAARLEATQPGTFLDLPEIFGDLGQNERFRAAYLAAQETVRVQGPLGAVQSLLGQEVGVT